MLRAVIYCRCSTEEEAQQNALQQQVIESRQCVRQQGWLVVGEYIEARSGTTTEKRGEYNRLFEDLQTDQFDIVQVKSQDRLMRNTKDWYLFIDRLVSNGKRLYLYLERKFYSADDALITGIKAILAEEFSKELSKKINNAHQHRQKDGRSFLLPPQTFGLQKDANGNFVPVEEEMEVIRIIFALSKDMGCTSIAHYLEENGYRNRNGKPVDSQAVRRIIRNPIRCGMVVQNRKHFDFQTKKPVSVPESEWVIHRNAVPAAVTEDEWREANEAMDRRSTGSKEQNQYLRGVNTGKYQLSGKIRCGVCKGPYYRTRRRACRSRKPVIEWKCQRYLQYGRNCEDKKRDSVRTVKIKPGRGCDNVHLEEEQLYHLLEKVAEQYYGKSVPDYQTIMNKAIRLLEEVLGEEDGSSEIKKLQRSIDRYEQQRSKLLDKLLAEVISDMDYKKRNQELTDKIKKLTEKKKAIQDRQENSQKEQPLAEQRLQIICERLETDILRQAMTAEILDSIRQIEVYEDKLRITFRPDQAPGIDAQMMEDTRGQAKSLATGTDSLEKGVQWEVALEKEFFYEGRKEAERERIVQYMRENPRITAKMIAQKEQVSVSAINARIRQLKKKGIVTFAGRGGHGEWIVHEGPDDG
ncbi:MAG: recombinase family protein [Clostridiales bacterium]|nr:recombinase family protein [Clostridiales bacterium]